MKNKYLIRAVFLFVVGLVSGCSGSGKEGKQEILYPEWNDVVSAFERTPQSLEKIVWLNGEMEKKTLQMDSVSWVKTCDFLKKINPNQSAYVGALEESNEDGWKVLSLKKGQSQSLKYVKMYRDESGNISAFEANVQEQTSVYNYGQLVRGMIGDDLVKGYSLEGGKKVFSKDSVTFKSLVTPKY